MKIDNILAILTVSCQLPPESQGKVRTVVESVSRTNRDPHLIFNQIGMELGFISEVIIRGAFLSLWARQNEDYCSDLVNKVKALLD
ncbi:hypothetical protein [Escherichia coli]|uniref:hypothetical protein n=1 Tax=Escherichia coli TaxID=562 RepID=UPI0019310D33|nr:hypothetical protein [Escherichia coli]